MSSSTTSLVQTLDTIIEERIAETLPTTTSVILLYKAGSTLIAIDLGVLSS